MRHHHRLYALCVVLIVCLFASVPYTLQAQAGVQVKTTADVNLRSVPQSTAKVIAVLTAGTTLPAVGRNQAATWIQVNSASGIGWVSAKFLTASGDLKTLPVTDSQPAPAPVGASASAGGVTGAVGANGITIRQQPSATSPKLGLLAPGTIVALTGRITGTPPWVRFSYQGQDAWLAGWLVVIHGDANTLPVIAPAAPAPTPAPAAPGGSPVAGTARLVFVNQLATTLHIVVQGPTPIDVNIGPNTTMSFDVTPGTYILNASAPERNTANRTITLAAKQQFTWTLHG